MNPAILAMLGARSAASFHFADNFNRVDGTLGSNWVAYQGLGFAIASNQAYSGSAQNIASRCTVAAPTDDYYVQANFVSGSGLVKEVGARANAGDLTRYALYHYNDVLYLASVSSNGLTHTTITSAPKAASLPYALRLEVQGSSLRGYLDGMLVVSAANALIPSGRYGSIRRGGTGALYVDDFEMGAL